MYRNYMAERVSPDHPAIVPLSRSLAMRTFKGSRGIQMTASGRDWTTCPEAPKVV